MDHLIRSLYSKIEKINKLASELATALDGLEPGSSIRLDIYLENQKKIFETEDLIQELTIFFSRTDKIKENFDMVTSGYKQLVLEKLDQKLEDINLTQTSGYSGEMK